MKLKKLNCPLCGGTMKTRIMTGDRCNSVSKICKKQKYYQYYCDDCNERKETPQDGWTSTESDELSLKDFK